MSVYIHKVESKVADFIGWTTKNKFEYIDVTISMDSTQLIHVQITF